MVVASASFFMGCTHLYSHQTTEDVTTNGIKQTITTDLRTTTFFDSKSELAKYTAFQSSKSQKLGIGALNAEASGSNVVNVFEAVARGAAAGAAKAVVPVP